MRLLNPSEDGLHSKNQLLGGEGFYNIILSSEFKPGYSITFRLPGGKKQEGNGRVVLMDLLCQLKAVAVPEHDIKDAQPGVLEFKAFHNFAHAFKLNYLKVSQFEVGLDDLPDGRIVLYNIYHASMVQLPVCRLKRNREFFTYSPPFTRLSSRRPPAGVFQ